MRNKLKLNLRWKKNSIDGINDSDLENDIKKIHETFSQTVIEEATTVIEKFANQEIEGYYGEYDPEYERREEEGNPPDYYYIRTDQMHNDSYKRFTDTKGKYRQGGIEFNPSETKHTGGYRRGQEKPTKPGITEEQIYTSVWDLGYHGRTSFTLRVYNSKGEDYKITETDYIRGEPHRFDRIIHNASAPNLINDFKKKGLLAVQKQNYSVLKFG